MLQSGPASIPSPNLDPRVQAIAEKIDSGLIRQSIQDLRALGFLPPELAPCLMRAFRNVQLSTEDSTAVSGLAACYARRYPADFSSDIISALYSKNDELFSRAISVCRNLGPACSLVISTLVELATSPEESRYLPCVHTLEGLAPYAIQALPRLLERGAKLKAIADPNSWEYKGAIVSIARHSVSSSKNHLMRNLAEGSDQERIFALDCLSSLAYYGPEFDSVIGGIVPKLLEWAGAKDANLAEAAFPVLCESRLYQVFPEQFPRPDFSSVQLELMWDGHKPKICGAAKLGRTIRSFRLLDSSQHEDARFTALERLRLILTDPNAATELLLKDLESADLTLREFKQPEQSYIAEAPTTTNASDLTWDITADLLCLAVSFEPQKLSPIILPRLQSPNLGLRLGVMRAVGYLDSWASGAIEPLYAELSSPYREIFDEALGALNHLSTKHAKKILELALGPGDQGLPLSSIARFNGTWTTDYIFERGLLVKALHASPDRQAYINVGIESPQAHRRELWSLVAGDLANAGHAQVCLTSQATSQLVQVLRQSTNRNSRAGAAHALGLKSDAGPERERALFEAMESGQAEIELAAISSAALGKDFSPALVDSLVHKFNEFPTCHQDYYEVSDGDMFRPTRSLLSLSNDIDPQNPVDETGHWRICLAIEAQFNLNPSLTLRILGNYLAHKNSAILAGTLWSFGNLAQGSPKVREFINSSSTQILSHFNSPDEIVRANVIRLLKVSGITFAGAANTKDLLLRSATQDNSILVRSRAHAALGIRFGHLPEVAALLWKAWHEWELAAACPECAGPETSFQSQHVNILEGMSGLFATDPRVAELFELVLSGYSNGDFAYGALKGLGHIRDYDITDRFYELGSMGDQTLQSMAIRAWQGYWPESDKQLRHLTLTSDGVIGPLALNALAECERQV